MKDYTLTFLVDQSPTHVFNSIINVRGWWQGLFDEEIVGESQAINDEFTFRAGSGAHYSKQRLVELIPGKRVVWLVTEGELQFVEKKDEWKGSRIVFDIAKAGNKTEVRFTHEGLTPEVQCFESCSSAWGSYLDQRFLPLVNAQRSSGV